MFLSFCRLNFDISTCCKVHRSKERLVDCLFDVKDRNSNLTMKDRSFSMFDERNRIELLYSTWTVKGEDSFRCFSCSDQRWIPSSRSLLTKDWTICAGFSSSVRLFVDRRWTSIFFSLDRNFCFLSRLFFLSFYSIFCVDLTRSFASLKTGFGLVPLRIVASLTTNATSRETTDFSRFVEHQKLDRRFISTEKRFFSNFFFISKQKNAQKSKVKRAKKSTQLTTRTKSEDRICFLRLKYIDLIFFLCCFFTSI